jgi:hypothetical protein
MSLDLMTSTKVSEAAKVQSLREAGVHQQLFQVPFAPFHLIFLLW